MENNTPKIPSIEELQEISRSNNYTSPPKLGLLNEVIKVLKRIPNFHKFLIERNFDYYELPYILFGEIIHYIKYCHQKNDTESIKKMLEYIDGMTKTKNDDVGDLL